jgi:hypothetical protein
MGYRLRQSPARQTTRAGEHALFLNALLALPTGSKHLLKRTVIFSTAPCPHLAIVGFMPPRLLSVWRHMADELVGRLNVAALEKSRVTPRTIIFLFGDLCKETKGASTSPGISLAISDKSSATGAGHNNPSLPL